MFPLRWHNIGLLLSSLTLIGIGTIIYLLYRPLSILMFKLFELTGSMRLVHTLRGLPWFPSDEDVPEWVIYSLPDGLWLLSFLLLMEYIWGNNAHKVKSSIVHAASIAAVAHELLQHLNILPGTWDKSDLYAYLIAIICYHAFTKTKILVS